MDFSELKEKRKDELRKAIDRQAELVSLLQRDFDDLDKFKKGNIIVNPNEYYPYYIIAGDPSMIEDAIRIPVRHHVYVQYESGDSFFLNMSGSVDWIDIYIDKVSSVKVITARELFEIEKEKLKSQFKSSRKRYEHEIKTNLDKIEQCNKYIEIARKELERHDSVDIDSEFDSFVQRTIERHFDKTEYKGSVPKEKKLHAALI